MRKAGALVARESEPVLVHWRSRPDGTGLGHSQSIDVLDAHFEQLGAEPVDVDAELTGS